MCDCTCEGFWRGFAKVFLIIVNIIFLLAGALMLAFGIALVAAPDKVLSTFSVGNFNFWDFAGSFGGNSSFVIQGVGIFMIILGGVVMIVSVFGFFGACCENSCMLVTYAVILIIIVLAEVALIIFGAVYPKNLADIETQISYKDLTSKFQRDFTVSANGTLDYTSLTDYGKSLATIQPLANCCGINNYTDYQTFLWTAATNSSAGKLYTSQNKVPLSCCIPNNPNQQPAQLADYKNYTACLSNPSYLNTYTQGCVSSLNGILDSFLSQYGKIAIGIAAGTAGLEIILIILAFILCCTHADGKYV